MKCIMKPLFCTRRKWAFYGSRKKELAVELFIQKTFLFLIFLIILLCWKDHVISPKLKSSKLNSYGYFSFEIQRNHDTNCIKYSILWPLVKIMFHNAQYPYADSCMCSISVMTDEHFFRMLMHGFFGSSFFLILSFNGGTLKWMKYFPWISFY